MPSSDERQIQESTGSQESTRSVYALADGDTTRAATETVEVAQGNEADTSPPRGHTFPVVGVGASAGGLESFTRLLKALPDDTGMAFVLVQHLDPHHDSQLSEILAGSTAMPVRLVEDGMAVRPNEVFLSRRIRRWYLRMAFCGSRLGTPGFTCRLTRFLNRLPVYRGRAPSRLSSPEMLLMAVRA